MRARRRYGPVFALELAEAGPAVVIGSVAAAQELEGSAASLSAGAARRSVLPQASPHSSFGGDDRRHAAARARIAPAMDPERIAALEGRIASIAGEHVAAWPAGRPFRVLSRMRTLTETIFVRLILGVADAGRADALVDSVGRALRTPGNPPLRPPDGDEGLRGRIAATVVERRVAPVKDLLVAAIEAAAAGDAEPGSILALTASDPDAPPPEELADELVVVLAAAQEPPSIALTWVLHRLAGDAELEARYLAEEPGSPFHEAVVNETLRVKPPALASLRRLDEPVAIDGHELPAGTTVMVPALLLHHDPAAWDEPGRFRPERFADGSPSPGFIPFGAGDRRCPAEWLARAELRRIVPVVLRRWRLRFLFPDERPVQRATVAVPHRSGLAIASARSAD